ncbi:hypothetical protein SLA2020_337910 [Shorea laevis]
MEEPFFDVVEFLRRPSIAETFVDILLCAVPIWVAVMIGLVVGWSWRPRWTGLVYLGFRSKLRFLWTLPPGFGARRLWLAFSALSAFPSPFAAPFGPTSNAEARHRRRRPHRSFPHKKIATPLGECSYNVFF